MKELNINGNRVVIYDSMQDASITRVQKYNLNLMLDADIGGDLDSFDNRATNIKLLIDRNPAEAKQEVTNMQVTVRMLMSGLSPEMRAFACLVYEINGRRITDEDLTDEGINDLLKELSRKGLTWGKVKAALNHVKKKLEDEREQLLPGSAGESEVKEVFTMIQRRAMLECQAVHSPSEEVERKLDKADEYFIDRIKPRNYFGPRGAEVRMINRFEDLSILLNQHHVSSAPKQMTALSFHRAVRIVEKQVKQQKSKSNSK